MMTLRMKGLVPVRCLALLVVGCFVVVAVVCTALMTGAVSAGSNSANCADKSALFGCLMSKSDHRAVNEFVLVNTLLFMAAGVVFVLRYKMKELQNSLFKYWRQFWCAEVLCWRDYLTELFSRGIVRSKIYRLALPVN